jgi:hypothetical protein
MKPIKTISGKAAPRSVRTLAAFTLPEISVSLAIFVMLMASVVVANLFGMRWFQIIQTKLKDSEYARVSVDRLSDDVRCCGSCYVGSISNGLFVAPAAGQPMSGNSLLVYSATNSTNYILYFLNTNDMSFRRTSTTVGTTTILAQSLTNTTLFQAQDCFGNVLTNNQNNFVIHCILQFYVPNPASPMPDSYKLETSVTPRSLD